MYLPSPRTPHRPPTTHQPPRQWLHNPMPSILATRYASPALQQIWSPEGRVRLERELWIAVLKAQRDLGLDVPPDAIPAYEAAIGHIDLASIDARERLTRHDVKARLDEFCHLAGHQQLHKGMTSRDLTENVEQLQIHRSLVELRTRAIAALTRLANHARTHRDTPLVARTHNVAAQVTTWGKRLATFAEELLHTTRSLDLLIKTYPARGLKGAVGTQLDLISLLGGYPARAALLESRLIEHLGLPATATAVGQVYPRSLDLEVVSTLVQLASAPSSFAKTLRLMAGHELASEGFAPGQTGSSAMPHKMNARSCERINGLHLVLKGHLTMAAGLAGDQWNEGDVACSVVRRVMLPDAFFAADGLFEAFLTILDQMEVYPAMLANELARYLPFLLSTTVLMEAVRRGAGREDAHEAIKEHAVATANAIRSGTTSHNDLLDRLAADPRLGLSLAQLEALLADATTRTGAAPQQVDHVLAAIADLAAQHPEAATYHPAPIL
jgi:adenylosuccinate lyase